MGRIKLARYIIQIVLVLSTILIITTCENDLQKYIFDDLFAYKIESAKLLPTNGSITESFGMAVDIDGDYAIVGAPAADGYMGAAYIFKKGSDGKWDSGHRITASDRAAGDKFGSAVAISGDWAVIGASSKNIGADTMAGQIYIFQRDNGGIWNETQIIDISQLNGGDIDPYDKFGGSVAIDGLWIVAGAGQDDLDTDPTGNTYYGAAYLLKRSGSTWSYNNRLDNGIVSSFFGASVDIDGDILVIGSSSEDTDGAGPGDKQGAAYIYRFVSDGWESYISNPLTASTPTIQAHLGSSIALSTNYLAVGAPSWEGVNGTVSFYTRTGTDEWNAAGVQELKPEEQKIEDLYGQVATDGSFILVGAPHADYYSSLSGAVFLYKIEENGTVTFKDTIAPKDISSIKGWGWSVAMDEGTSIIGATDPYNSEDGVVYIFE